MEKRPASHIRRIKPWVRRKFCTHLKEATVREFEYPDEDEELHFYTPAWWEVSSIVHIDEYRYTCSACHEVMYYTADEQDTRIPTK